jgi:hypothetical protein
MRPRHIVRQHLQRKADKPVRLPAVLGDGANRLSVTGQANRVYVTLAGGIVGQAFNNRVQASYGLPVWVGYDPVEPDTWQVLAVRAGAAEAAGFDLGGTGYAPASRYRWNYPGGGQDPLYVEGRQFLPLRLGPHTGLSVYVYPWVVWTGSAWAYVPATAVDLTASVPAAEGQARLVLVTVDEAGAVVTTAGTAVALADLGLDDLPSVPAGTRYVVGAVRLYYGQTAIQEGRSNTDIVDLRDLPGAWGTGSSSISGPLDMGGEPINNLADPTEAQDAATKAYVDANSSATPPAGQISRLRFDGLAADAVTITDDSSHNGFPGLAKLADGTLIVVYRKASNHAPSKGVIAQKISTDGGKTWGSESTIYSHATADAREPCLTVLSDGSLALTFSLLDAATAAYLPGDQVYILKSTDGGATWGSPVNVNNTGFTSWSYTSSPVLELVNGNLILAVYGQMTGDTYRSVRVVVSTNDGASWGSSTLVASGQTASKDYDEPNLVQLANGDVLCAFKNLTDLRGYVSTSTDRGATWGTAADEFACGGCPRLLRLTSDTVLCHTRQPITNTLVAYTSTDGGATWSDAVTISATTYDSVYSQAVEQAGGLIAIAYALELVDQTDANVYMAWLGEGASTLPLVAKSLTVYGGDVEIAGGGQFVSQTPTGTAPLDVQSTTVVPNLNADLLDGYHASQFLTAATHWEPVTNGDASSPEIVFHDGDVVMQEVNN